MDVKNTHSVTKTEISVFGRQSVNVSMYNKTQSCPGRFQLVVANILETRKREVVMVTPESEETVKMEEEELKRGDEIEAKIVAEVIKRHRAFRHESETAAS